MSRNTVMFRWWGRADTGVGAGSRSRRGDRLRLRPTVLALEDRTLLSFTVLNTNDSGSGSLRYEVGLANAEGGTNTINFNTNPALGTNFNTPQTITLTSGQLDVTDNGLTIMGPAAGVTVSGGGNSRILAVESGVTAIISNLTITDGSTQSDDYGGGLYNRGNLTLNYCTVSNDTAGGSYWGGGLYNTSGGTLTLNYCTVSNDTAGHYGGGLYNDSGTVNLTNCTFSNDRAGNTYYGGGLYNNSTANLMNSTFSNDKASYGGGVHIGNGTANVVDCTFNDDTARHDGGGLYNFGSTLTLTSCTISGNSATSSGGGLYNAGAATLTDTIVAGNTNNSNGASDIGFAEGNPWDPRSTPVTGTFNLIGTGGAGGIPTGPETGNIIGVANPGLATLGYYGGPTETMALLPASPAIGAGTASGVPEADQRGFPLDMPTPDIGALSVRGLPPASGEHDRRRLGRAIQGVDLRGAVNLADIMPGDHTITFDKTVFAAAQTITLTSGQLVLSNTGGVQTITGPAAGATVSGGSSRVFQVEHECHSVDLGADHRGGHCG